MAWRLGSWEPGGAGGAGGEGGGAGGGRRAPLSIALDLLGAAAGGSACTEGRAPPADAAAAAAAAIPPLAAYARRLVRRLGTLHPEAHCGRGEARGRRL